MNIKEKNIIWLNMFEGLTLNKKEEILSLFDGQDIRKYFYSKPQLKQLVNEMEYTKMSNMLDDYILENELTYCEKNNVIILFRDDPNVPQLLLEIDSPPLCLYCKGNIQLLNTKCVAVVGTRKPTEYGIVVTKQYVKEFVDFDLTIVSGLASGIDTIAHTTALQHEGKTIAVLAGGFDCIYPKSNSYLARKLTENNLLISENRPNCPHLNYLFPIRNRIIAGLSEAVVIPEAGINSGTMHTKNFAIDYNRELFAVPGKITSPQSAGSNAIIKEFPTAITTEPKDVMIAINVDLNKNLENSNIQLDILSQSVLNYIQTEKHTFQEIADHLKLTASELNAKMFELEMAGLVIKLSNNSYIKA